MKFERIDGGYTGPRLSLARIPVPGLKQAMKEYTALRHKPTKEEKKCTASNIMTRGKGRLFPREVHCDWVEGHQGPHNQLKGDWVWSASTVETPFKSL